MAIATAACLRALPAAARRVCGNSHRIAKFAAGLAILASLGASLPARGAGVVLDDALRAHLAELAPVTGEAVAGARLRDRVVLVTFFASWCPPCRTEFHHLNELAIEEPGSSLTIVAVNVFEAWDENDEARMSKFLADTAPRFHVVEGTDETKRRFGDVDRIPTVFVFGPDGAPALHFIHARGAKKMTATLAELREAIARAKKR